ncbi:carboxy terminal-processing peptidase [Corallincola spongiicola]|uniref:carboxy terminal-processing peptidase n=1 Tax=Corallincola spongiicola TaxID=2520508 RepID=UPI001FE285D9|nr:carboxy terminal-processing peptidase [Corallincola spongiicola]
MKRLITHSVTSLLIGGLLSASAYALAPKYDEASLPALVQQSQHKDAAMRITNTFQRSHYKKIALNDEMSSQILDRYLKQLDFRRNIFLASDIEKFEKYRFELDSALKKGQLAPAYEIYDVFQKRRYDRYVYALSLLDKPFDFNTDDKYVYEREDAPWAKNSAELDELWRQWVKYEALNLKLAGKTPDEIKELLSKRYNYAIKRLTQAQSEDVFQTFINAFARSIEPHTSYLSPRNADRFKMEMNLQLEGIGAVLQSTDDYTVIRSLVKGGPAEKSKQLAPQDKIVGVAQEGKDMVDIVGWRLDDVVDLIKGPKGTEVRLEIMTENAGGDAKSKVVTIVRDKIRLEDRAAKLTYEKAELEGYEGKKVAVIEIPGFYVNLSKDVQKLLFELNEVKDVDGLIIDLRNNGGGSLEEAKLLTGLFIDSGPVVQVRSQNGRIEEKVDVDNEKLYQGPLTVLVNRYSASASEIFAAALQDYGRALVVGEQTFGKGTVQQHKGIGRIYDLYDSPMGDIQYTIAKFYRISGGSTQNKGVVPDIKFPSEVRPGEFGESTEDNALPYDQITRARYKSYGEPTPALDSLVQKHESRLTQNPEFVYVYQDIEEYRARKDDTSISLNEKQRLAQREAEEKKRLARLNERRVRHELKPLESLEAFDDLKDEEKVPDQDLYLSETVYITLDLVEAGRLAKAN